MARPRPEIKTLYYITHVANLNSIFARGILSHALIEELHLTYTPVYDDRIVASRKSRVAPGGENLWEFANLYFQARNPMLYRVLHEKADSDIVVLGIRPTVFSCPGVLIAPGNAASRATDLLAPAEGLKAIAKIWDCITSEWWNSMDGSKRRIMAECLVPRHVPSDLIHTVYVSSHSAADKVRGLALPSHVAIVPEPTMFFRPARRFRVTDRLFLAEGDMFFSTMQTLTVSVNTVGIMGKGLASRAKYQFPDVYVFYQDACRKKQLRLGHPYLYKRESCVDIELADDPETLPGPNATKWFLLFATKKHWRYDSDLGVIDQGLAWVVDNYKSEGIESLALPALGCGLGRLDWREVGPIMCRRLAGVSIPIAIYLPREAALDNELLSPEYLLK
ncbi:MAG: DUF4433 domain-containing protein [Acidobacteria bacterium]|nr:DUF4433 domain-containing protein [Acidobacteriota bacterium]